MAKKPSKQRFPIQPQVAPVLKPLTTSEKIIYFFGDIRNQLLILIALIAVFYGNSVPNGYALDDSMFIVENHFVQQGMDGVSDLFTKESMVGFIGNTDQISGGRWRPLSLITFAIEKQFFGKQPHISHLINLFILALIAFIMLSVLRKFIFKSSPLSAFIVTLLFIIHPVHTEAISNIKSRDELMSWLFLLLTLYYSLNFLTVKKYWQLLFSCLFYFLALLSKENGISFIIILPLSFHFFTKEKTVRIIRTTIPFIIVFAIYILLRISYVPLRESNANEVMNAPYLFATPIQHFATVLMILGKYILLLVYPNPLSSDYSYNQIPYVDFSDWRVWLAIIVQVGLLLYALLKLKEKNLIAYGILFYFISMFLVSNLVIDVGTFIGERFLFQPSFGFCIAIVVFISEALKKIKFKTGLSKFSTVSILLIGVTLLSAFQTIQRNKEWESDITLGMADVEKVPNSARAQNTCGISEILLTNEIKDDEKKSMLLHDAIIHLKRAHEIQPTYTDPWLNMGVAYLGIENLDSTEYCWEQVRKLSPHLPKLTQEYDPIMCQRFINAGLTAASKKDYQTGRSYFYRALKHGKNNPAVWYNLGGYYYTVGNYDSAKITWQRCLELKPDYTDAQNGLNALAHISK